MFKFLTYGSRFLAPLLTVLILFAVGTESALAGICDRLLAPSAAEGLWTKWEADFKQSPNLAQVRATLLSQAKQPGFVSSMRSSLKQFRSDLHSNSERWLSKMTQTPGGVEDVDIVIIGGTHATAVSAMLADRMRALAAEGRLPRIPRVLFINDGDEPNRFVGQTFLLNSPYYIEGDGSGHSDLYDYDANPVPGSPLDAVTIHTGLASEGSALRFDGLGGEAFITPVPPEDSKGWQMKPGTHLSYMYPQASWLGDATLLAHKYSTIPVLLGTRITAVNRKRRESNYVLTTNHGFSIRTPIVVLANGMGDERMPFSDPKSLQAFQAARSSKLGGTAGDVLNWSREPGFFQSLKNKKILLMGGGDGGNMIIQRLKGLDPRGTHYKRQAPDDIAQSIDLYWADQTAKNGKAFISWQAMGGAFRKPLYALVGNLFGQSGFHPTKSKAKRMSVLPDGRFHVTFTDNHEDDFDRVYAAAGYDENFDLMDFDGDLTPQRGRIQSPASSNFGKKVIIAEGYSSSNTLFLNTGATIAALLGNEGKLEVDPAGDETHAHGLRNLAFRAAEIPELIVKQLVKLGIVEQ